MPSANVSLPVGSPGATQNVATIAGRKTVVLVGPNPDGTGVVVNIEGGDGTSMAVLNVAGPMVSPAVFTTDAKVGSMRTRVVDGTAAGSTCNVTGESVTGTTTALAIGAPGAIVDLGTTPGAGRTVTLSGADPSAFDPSEIEILGSNNGTGFAYLGEILGVSGVLELPENVRYIRTNRRRGTGGAMSVSTTPPTGGSATPSGPAGGVLSGTYPNPVRLDAYINRGSGSFGLPIAADPITPGASLDLFPDPDAAGAGVDGVGTVLFGQRGGGANGGPGGRGGFVGIAGAQGGDGDAVDVAGEGGNAVMRGGEAGANGGAGGANGGNANVDAGPGSGAGLNGVVNVGTDNTRTRGVVLGATPDAGVPQDTPFVNAAGAFGFLNRLALFEQAQNVGAGADTLTYGFNAPTIKGLTSAANRTMTSTPTLETPADPSQEWLVILRNRSGAGITFTLQGESVLPGSGLLLQGGTVTLDRFGSIGLVWSPDANAWVEAFRTTTPA